MIRAYHDPGLRYPISRNGSWETALELPMGPGRQRAKTIYLHNPDPDPVALDLSSVAPPAGFTLELPDEVVAQPGTTPLTVSMSASASIDLPAVADFAIQAGDLRLEVSAFALPVADERFARSYVSPLAGVEEFTDYLASGMGFVDAGYREALVAFMADKALDLAVWALNKHYLFDARFAPMRLAQSRALSMGYDPPGVASMAPDIRRRVYHQAFDLARATGSYRGILGIFEAIGVPLVQISVWREDFTWYVRIPQWVNVAYGTNLLGALALYHVDAYCTVNLGIHGDTLGNEFFDISHTGDAAP